MIESLLPRAFDLVDLSVVWLLLWAAVSWLRRTPARVGLAGLATLMVLFLAVRQIGLEFTTWVLQGFAAVAALTAVVVFQQDLRRLFEQIASLWLGRERPVPDQSALDTIARVAARLAAQRRGALMVIPGREHLESHLEGGIRLDGRVSEPLLYSLFDPNSPGHDGAVILDGEIVRAFAAHLPLSTDHEQLGQRGTRHAAALGLTTRCDAMVVVVSEERGEISVAEAGTLRKVGSAVELAETLRAFVRRIRPQAAGRGARALWPLREWKSGAIALPVTAALWLIGVPGAANIEVTRTAKVDVSGVPKSYELIEIDPDEVDVVLSGPRRAVFLASGEALSVEVDALLVDLGRRTFPIQAENVRAPEGLRVVSTSPEKVRLSLEKRK